MPSKVKGAVRFLRGKNKEHEPVLLDSASPDLPRKSQPSTPSKEPPRFHSHSSSPVAERAGRESPPPHPSFPQGSPEEQGSSGKSSVSPSQAKAQTPDPYSSPDPDPSPEAGPTEDGAEPKPDEDEALEGEMTPGPPRLDTPTRPCDEETGMETATGPVSKAVSSKSSPGALPTQSVRVKVCIKTEFLKDTLCIPVLRAGSVTLGDFLQTVQKRYEAWHSFKVYSFALTRFRHRNSEWVDRSQRPEAPLLECFDVHRKTRHAALECFVHESEESVTQREEDRRREEEERRRQEAERKRLEAIRQARIKALKLKGECWMLEGFAGALDVPIDQEGMVAVNKGSLDQWVTIRYVRAIRPSKKFYYAVKLDKLPYTTNSWKICIGYVPISFKLQAQRHWVGAQKSWSYIAGTGGKCHDSGKSIPYGEKYAEGDVIGCLVDFGEGTIEFFKNNVSQGVAFRNVSGAVYPAVSVTSTDCHCRLVSDVPPEYSSLMNEIKVEEQSRRKRWSEILSLATEAKQMDDFADSGLNAWSPKVSVEKDEALWYPDTGPVVDTVVNEGSDDKWRSSRAVGAYDSGQHLIEFKIVADRKTTNTWRIGIGVVPTHFSAAADRAWVGAQRSWVYITGTGGKCYNKGKSEAYGEASGKNDRVGILLDFTKGEIEFFLNGETQGVAFTNLTGPVHPAVSMTGTGTAVQLLPTVPGLLEKYRERAKFKIAERARVSELYGNVWDPKKLSSDVAIEDYTAAVCTSKTNKWRAAASMIQYASGRRYFEVLIDKAPATSNSWRICVGVVTKDFCFKHQKLWIGSKFSWSYIGGTGGKCHVGAKSESYGQKFGKGDRIGCLMDFDNRTLEFYKNDIPQGEAFTDLTGPVYAAVSVTGHNTRVVLRAKAEEDKMGDYALYH